MRFCVVIVAILLSIGFTACDGRKVLSYDELTSFPLEPSNGLLKKVEKNNTVIEAIFHPNDLIVAQEITGTELSNEDIEAARSRFGNYSYFIFKLSSQGKDILIDYSTNPHQLDNALNYLSYEIGKDILLICESDTVRVADFIHTRAHGSSSSTNLLIAFERNVQNTEGDKAILVFNDTFFGTGRTEFEYTIKDIESIPPLDFNTLDL